jgi:hypothetical protein
MSELKRGKKSKKQKETLTSSYWSGEWPEIPRAERIYFVTGHDRGAESCRKNIGDLYLPWQLP